MTIKDVVNDAYNKWKDRDYVWTNINGTYVAKTFGEMINDTWALAKELLSMKLKGKKVIVYGENSYEWMISDLAIIGFVGIHVAVNKEWNQRELESILDFMDIEAIIYSESKDDIINKIKKKYKKIRYISIEKDLKELLANGYKKLNKKKDDFEEIDINSPSKIIFSSGTTSEPKASMLTQKNMLFGWNSLYKRAPLNESDICYLFLPLHHTYAGIYNFLYSLIGGWQIYLCSGVNNLVNELKIVKPTVMCGVPLIYEKVYNNIDEKTMKKINSVIFISNILRKFKIDIRRKLFGKLHDVFGGHMKYLFSGGAFFKTHIRKFYKDVGFNMMEAYALTETASSFSIEYSNSDDIKSVGTIFEDIDVKIVDIDKNGHGEIVVKGDNVCLGYYNNDKANKMAFDADGYFHTGDIGYIDNERRLYLVGRKKRVIITNNGYNVYPDEIESLFSSIEGINKIKVYEKSDRIMATIYVKEDNINIRKTIDEINETLPKYKKIKDYKITLDSIDTRIK